MVRTFLSVGQLFLETQSILVSKLDRPSCDGASWLAWWCNACRLSFPISMTIPLCCICAVIAEKEGYPPGPPVYSRAEGAILPSREPRSLHTQRLGEPMRPTGHFGLQRKARRPPGETAPRRPSQLVL